MSSTFKIVLLGEGRVGKTSLVSRFVKDQFDSQEASTVQASMYSKMKLEIDGKPVDVSVWDTAGQERFHALGPIYYRNSNGAVLVYDITDPDTFERTKMWLRELRNVVGEGIQIVLCGNKGDLEKEREVPVEMANEWAQSQGALHFTTSAKTALNVNEAFTALVTAIVKTGGGGASRSKRGKKGAGGAVGGGDSLAMTGSRPKKRGVKIDTSGSGENTADTSTSASSASYGGGGDDYDESPSPMESPRQQEKGRSGGPRPISIADGGQKKEEKKKKKKCCD